MLRIGITSDTHLGLTKEKSIRKMLKRLEKQSIDILIHVGDYCGGHKGYRSVNSTVKLAREILPEVEFVSVLGNHDYWHIGNKRQVNADFTSHYGYPTIFTYNDNYNRIIDSFKQYNVHFLDEDGVYRNNNWPGFAIVGHSGWYKHMNPPTNDYKYLPMKVEGNTNNWMYKRATEKALDNLTQLNEGDKCLLYVSHFPIVDPHQNSKFDLFGGDKDFGEHVKETYKPCAFINGHAHERHEGILTNSDLRFESGSDYFSPRELIVEVDVQNNTCVVVKDK